MARGGVGTFGTPTNRVVTCVPQGEHPAVRMAPFLASPPGLARVYGQGLPCHVTGNYGKGRVGVRTIKPSPQRAAFKFLSTGILLLCVHKSTRLLWLIK